MIKSQLINAMANKMTHLSVNTVEDSVNLILAVMSQAIVNGQRIEIRDFAAFSIREMKQRPAHNPKTGEKPWFPLSAKFISSQDLDLKRGLWNPWGGCPLKKTRFRPRYFLQTLVLFS